LFWPCTQRCSTNLAPLEDPIRTRAAIHLIGSGNNVLPAVTPGHDMVDGARILHSHRARHAVEDAKPDGNVNHRNEPQPGRSANLRFDPKGAIPYMHRRYTVAIPWQHAQGVKNSRHSQHAVAHWGAHFGWGRFVVGKCPATRGGSENSPLIDQPSAPDPSI
jgi:hypothetical protein